MGGRIHGIFQGIILVFYWGGGQEKNSGQPISTWDSNHVCPEFIICVTAESTHSVNSMG
jgi:hypothetical protein